MLTMSAIVPTYNRGPLIAETIESLLCQQPPFARVIVVDDGSTDDTPAVLAGYGSRLHVERTENRGVQQARNLGVQLARTEWVTFVDSDDLLEPGFTACVQRFLKANPEFELLYVNHRTFSGPSLHPDKLSLAPPAFLEGARRSDDFYVDVPQLYRRLLDYQPLFPSGMTIRREAYERLGGFDPAFRSVKAEDFELTLRAVAALRTAISSPVLARIRKHGGNESHDSLSTTLGEVTILEHALLHHPAAAEHRDAVLASIDLRRRDAFNAAFGRGDLDLAATLLGRIAHLSLSPRERLKAFISRLPPGFLRSTAWEMTQLPGRSQAALARERPRPARPAPGHIVVIEPAWSGETHLPVNLGMLIVAARAYPQARMTFVGESRQAARLGDMLPRDLVPRVSSQSWNVWRDIDTLPEDHLRRLWELRQLPRQIIDTSELILLLSCNASTLQALTTLGLAPKAVCLFHGDANELVGWRSRNPLRRHLDLVASLRRFCREGGRAAFLEQRVADGLGRLLPWLRPSIVLLPHPLLTAEQISRDADVPLSSPIQIGFPGQASPARGFPEFIRLAQALSARCPGRFAFHAIGYLPGHTAHMDQSILATAARPRTIPRHDFRCRLIRLDFIFLWLGDGYYRFSPSGVLYDAINLGIPLLARDAGQIRALNDSGSPVALTFQSIDELIDSLCAAPRERLERTHRELRQNLLALRDTLSEEALASRLRQIVESPAAAGG